jgi:molybdate transport system substrate-binding protein
MIRLATACLLVLLSAQAKAAEITVLCAGAISPIVQALDMKYETTTHNTIILRVDTVGGMLHRIEAGQNFDVVMTSAAGLDALAKAGKIAQGSRVKLADVGIGVGIKTGSKAPDISTVAAFKATLLASRKVAYIDPASGGSSGIYVGKLLQTLGIADAMAPKSVLVKGGFAARAILDGSADLAVQQISELNAVPGITVVGKLPADIQHLTPYAGAISANSIAPDAAKAFLATMSGPLARPVLEANGMNQP